MAVRGFDHVAITVADVDATLAFYTKVLGAEALYEELWREGKIPIAMMQIGSNRLSIHPAAKPAAPHAKLPTSGSADLCFRWDGPIAAAATHLTSQGIEVEVGPVPRPSADGGEGRSVYFRDPDGNLLELLSTDG